MILGFYLLNIDINFQKILKSTFKTLNYGLILNYEIGFVNRFRKSVSYYMV